MPASAPLLPRIGAHVSAAGGLREALRRAREIGAEVIQVFPGNPRQWRRAPLSVEELAASGRDLRRAGIPLFVHSIYLINLASPDPQLAERSSTALAHALAFGALCGSAGVVTHVGSHRGEGFERALGRVSDSVSRAFDLARRQTADVGPAALPPLLFESAAGSRNSVGGSVVELARLLGVAPGQSGVCLDTAHLFAAGHQIHTAEGLDRYFDELDGSVGLRRVGLVHLNDSRSEFGSRADRHENLWEGRIGRAGLALWVGRPELRDVAMVIETPGFDERGPDRRNLMRAKRLRREAYARAKG